MHRTLTTLTLALSLATALHASPVGIYVNDNFTNPTLDSTVWNSSGAGVSIVSNQVKIQGGWIQSKAMVSPSVGETVTLNATGIWNTPYSYDTYWGLTDAAENNYIILDSQGDWYVKMKNGGISQTTAGKVEWGDQMRYNWTIDWKPNQVVITKTVGATTTVVFDSSVTAPNGGGSWNFPGVDMGIKAGALNSSNELYFSSLSLEVVPEPASLALLGAAVLLLPRRRQQ